MGFLDNLESSLKSLEGNQERDNAAQDRQRRNDERARSLAIAPNAEALKKSPFVNELLMQAVRIGHGQRTKVNMVWIGPVLRLDARESRLELQPTPEGIVAVISKEGEEVSRRPVDLSGDAGELASDWLG